MSGSRTSFAGAADPRRNQSYNLVGSRELIAVQTFDVARLTTHAVPIVPGTFVAVSGVGPKGDSNGSGKTSFLAAVTVLLADPQWRLDVNGGQLAAGLLFRPDAAGLEASRVSPAPHGYIVGVFAEPSDPTGAEDTLITVWIRLSTTSPHLQARWAVGLHVADADNDNQRYEQADAIWMAMPPAQRCSARAMQATLYGDAPRCMAYLDTTLRRAAASLLSQQMTEMSPEAIGQSLIDLAGLRQVLEQEQEQRSALAEQQRAQSDAEVAHERRLLEENAERAAVDNRQRARTALTHGELMWRLHFARRYVEIVVEHEAATKRVDELTDVHSAAETDVVEAKTAHQLLADRRDLPDAEQTARIHWTEAKDAREATAQRRAVLAADRGKIAADRPRLVGAAEGWDGQTVAEHVTAVDAARKDAANASARHELLQDEVEQAASALRQSEAGTPTDVAEAMSALSAARVPCAAVADTLTIDEPARYWWEPVIRPWLSAVVVTPHNLQKARSALSHLPGTILVASDNPLTDDNTEAATVRLPAGLHASVPIGGFLRVLASRHDHIADPPCAVDSIAGITVIGGFDVAIAGRQARIATARHTLNVAERKAGTAHRAVQQAALAQARAVAALDRATAAEQLARQDSVAIGLDAEISACECLTEVQEEAENAALQNWTAANVLAAQHKNQVDAAKWMVERAEHGVRDIVSAVKKAQAERDALHLPYWRDGWAGTVGEAQHLLEQQDDTVRRLTAKRLRNRAQEALKDALDAYRADVHDLPSDIRDVADHREDLTDGDDPLPGSLTFLELSRPLQTRLDGTADRDATTQTTIRLDRARRQHTIETLREEVQDRTGALEAIQDMIERSVEGHFQRMSTALNTLDLARGGYGAELDIVSRRPETATSAWRWQVSPRWRRIRDGKMINYREVANGAQVKVYAVQVTLAALLAADSTAGRVLVIDELGNSLGEVNRKDVLTALRQVAERQRVTILGTCQDSVLYDAAEACQEILWFTHASTADAYNQPVRVWAHDPEHGRVELTADWMRSFRPWI
jgi:hypothetical protein